MELLKCSTPPASSLAGAGFLAGGGNNQNLAKTRHRRRHRTYLLAHEETTKLFNEDRIKSIVRYAKEYQNDVKDKKIILLNEEEQKALVLDYYTRFSARYIKRFYGKVYSLAEDLVNAAIFKKTYTTLVTLTIAPEYYFSLSYAYRNLRKELHKLMTALKREYGDSILGYLFIPELGKKNYRLHGHILIVHTCKWISVEKIRRNYKIGNVDVKRRFGNAKSGINYVLKYVSKYWNETDELGKLTLAVFWSLNARVYSHNRLKIVSLEQPRLIETKWVFVGSFDASEIGLEAGIYDINQVYPKVLDLLT